MAERRNLVSARVPSRSEPLALFGPAVYLYKLPPIELHLETNRYLLHYKRIVFLNWQNKVQCVGGCLIICDIAVGHVVGKHTRFSAVRFVTQ